MGIIYKEVQNYVKSIDATLGESQSGSIFAEKAATDLESASNPTAPHKHAKSHAGVKDVTAKVEGARKGAGKVKGQFSIVRAKLFEVSFLIQTSLNSYQLTDPA